VRRQAVDESVATVDGRRSAGDATVDTMVDSFGVRGIRP